MGAFETLEGWVLSHTVRNSAAYYIFGTGVMIGNPRTRQFGLRMASFGLRGGANWYRGALLGRGPGLMGTTLVRGGSMTLGRAAAMGAYTGAAVAGIVAAGYGVSYVIGEEMGYEDATKDYTEFMTGKVSIGDWWDAVTLKSLRE